MIKVTFFFFGFGWTFSIDCFKLIEFGHLKLEGGVGELRMVNNKIQ